MKVALAVVAVLSVGALLGVAAPPICSASDAKMRIPVATFLCQTAKQAVQFADIVALGDVDEIAKDRVGRAAGAEVCGRYVGIATIVSEHVELEDGTAYRLTAYRFEDKRVAWLAEPSFAPVGSTSWGL